MSAKPFLITGMPRCRMAWLSVLCTTGASMCYFDSSMEMTDIEDLKAIYQSEYYKFVGIADHELSFFLPWILENIKPRTLILDRDPKEVLPNDFRGKDIILNAPKFAHEEIEKFHYHPLVMFVPCEALKTKRVIQKIYWHLMPGEPFNDERYDQMEKLLIGADPKESAKQYAKRKPQIDRLMRSIEREAVAG